MMAEAALQPDTETIRRHLSHLTARWHELGEPVLLETVFLNAEDAAQVKDARRWRLEQIEEAVAHIAGMNLYRVNAYATVNPVRADAGIGPGKRASAAHIAASFFHWADADDDRAAENIRAFKVGPQPTFFVITGRHPCARPHVYWELEEPTCNLGAWEQTQRAIAAALGTDPAVVDPPRIMRLAGTVNWPKPRKQAKGYVAEVTTLHIYPDRDRVSSERMALAFRAAAQERSGEAPQGGAFTIDTGPQSLDRERATIQALSGQEWHNAVIRLVASYVARGLSDGEIHALTQPLTLAGYTGEQTAREVQTAIDGARAKGWAPEAEPQAPPTADLGDFNLTGLTPDDLTNIPPRRWLYGRKLVRGFCSLLVSPGGTAKSTYVAAMAADLASGVQTLHDQPHGALRVWVYNLEDPRDESLRKMAAIWRARGLSREALARIVIHSGRDRPLILAEEVGRSVIVASPDVARVIAAIRSSGIDVLVVDPFIRAHRLDENDNKHVDFIMDLFARIADEADCAVLLVHHARKGFVSGDADSIRGGSAMSSAARVALTMQTMQPEDAERFNIAESERRLYVRIDSAKANLAPPADAAEWVKLESVQLGNGTEEYPEGDTVGAIVAWNPPSAWEGVAEKTMDILDRIERGFVNEDGATEPWSFSKRANERWVANAVLASFPSAEKSEAQAVAVLRHWREKGFITEYEYINSNRHKRMGVKVSGRPDDGQA